MSSEGSEAQIKLTYFDFYGRGELARLLLAFGGLEYEDNRIPKPWEDPNPWMEIKPGNKSFFNPFFQRFRNATDFNTMIQVLFNLI